MRPFERKYWLAPASTRRHTLLACGARVQGFFVALGFFP